MTGFDPALKAFFDGLTDLSLKTGIAVADGAQLYVMEEEDRPYRYASDSEDADKLVRR